MKNPFRALGNSLFRRLYLSQTISLLGDAFTWVGIALLAYQIGGQHSAAILSMALTLRVTAFILFGPYAGAMADRVDRKKVMYLTHFVRMAIVGCLPFVTNEWQVYSLIFFLNIFNAFFKAAYKAAVPWSIKSKDDYSSGIALSNATEQLLGVHGPGLAGAMAAWLGAREIFFVDAGSFIVAAIIILSLSPLFVRREAKGDVMPPKIWMDVFEGHEALIWQ